LIRRRIDAGPEGPDIHERRTARVHLWGQARNSAGHSVEARLETPEAYAFTVSAALACVTKVLEGTHLVGATTPATAFGTDLVHEIPGVISR
jgi:short subunit dehydrogenase-like uncharacterized protein